MREATEGEKVQAATGALQGPDSAPSIGGNLAVLNVIGSSFRLQ